MDEKKGVWIILSVFFIILIIFAYLNLLKPPLPGYEDDNDKEEIVQADTKQEIPVVILKAPKIAPIDSKEIEYTMNEIFSNAESHGTEFCSNLDEEYLIEPCERRAILIEATTTEDPDKCDQISDPKLVEKCKVDLIIELVALAYYEESKSDGEGTIPSNIALCNQLDDEEDRKLCRDPGKVFVKDYNGIINRVK